MRTKICFYLYYFIMVISMGFEGFPFIVGWELTLACNLRCRHCGSSAGLPRNDELSLKESLAICDQCPELLVQEVNFTGGEPLLRPEWSIIATHLRDLGIRTKIITNGLALDPSTVAQIKSVSVSGIGISLDGMNLTHDRIRNHNGLSQQIFRSIDLILNANIPLTVITTVNSLNINELHSMFEILHSSGVNSWKVQPIFVLGRTRENPELSLTPKDYMNLGNFVKEIFPQAEKHGIDIRLGDSFGYFTEFDLRDPPWSGCPAGQVSVGITSNGKIKGCLSLPDEFIEGDLRCNDLWDIWFNPSSFEYSRKISSLDFGSNCSSCEKANECRGGCTAMSFGCTGLVHNDPYCFHAMKKYS